MELVKKWRVFTERGTFEASLRRREPGNYETVYAEWHQCEAKDHIFRVYLDPPKDNKGLIQVRATSVMMECLMEIISHGGAIVKIEHMRAVDD